MVEQATTIQRAPEPTPRIVKSETLVSRVDSLIDEITRRAYEIFERDGRQLGHDLEYWVKAESELLHPTKIKIEETDQALEVKAEVPGFSEKELEISVEAQRLTIIGKHEQSKEGKKGTTVYAETNACDILRVIALPAEVDVAKASATVKHGILTVTLPKPVGIQAAEVVSQASQVRTQAA